MQFLSQSIFLFLPRGTRGLVLTDTPNEKGDELLRSRGLGCTRNNFPPDHESITRLEYNLRGDNRLVGVIPDLLYMSLH